MPQDRPLKNALVLEKEKDIIRDCTKIIRGVRSVEGHFLFFCFCFGGIVIIVWNSKFYSCLFIFIPYLPSLVRFHATLNESRMPFVYNRVHKVLFGHMQRTKTLSSFWQMVFL